MDKKTIEITIHCPLCTGTNLTMEREEGNARLKCVECGCEWIIIKPVAHDYRVVKEPKKKSRLAENIAKGIVTGWLLRR